MASVNKVFLLGNLTRDPELRYLPSGAATTKLGIAVNRVYVTKDGERREEVTFVDVTVWNRQAETCAQYLKKGRPVHVEGHLVLESWDDKATGQKRTQLKVVAEQVQFLGGARDDGGGLPPVRDDEAAAPPPRRSTSPPAAAPNGPARSYNSSPAPTRQSNDEAEADDDIPF